MTSPELRALPGTFPERRAFPRQLEVNYRVLSKKTGKIFNAYISPLNRRLSKQRVDPIQPCSALCAGSCQGGSLLPGSVHSRILPRCCREDERPRAASPPPALGAFALLRETYCGLSAPCLLCPTGQLVRVMLRPDGGQAGRTRVPECHEVRGSDCRRGRGL